MAADRDRFQYEHICAQIVREAESGGRSVQEILDAIYEELRQHQDDYNVRPRCA